MNRFDLEQEIMRCWAVTEDINLVYESTDWNNPDEVRNALLSLHTLYELKFQRLWNTFEKCIEI